MELSIESITKNYSSKTAVDNVSIKNNWLVEIGYVPVITASIARNNENIVFVKKSDDTFVTLLITLLPSDTT